MSLQYVHKTLFGRIKHWAVKGKICTLLANIVCVVGIRARLLAGLLIPLLVLLLALLFCCCCCGSPADGKDRLEFGPEHLVFILSVWIHFKTIC